MLSISDYLFLIAFFVGIPALFVGVLIAVCIILSRGGGWNILSKRFRAESRPSGQAWSAGPFFYTVRMRSQKYSSIIRITVAEDEDSVYFSVLFPFRFGHPMLRIPWKEISLEKMENFWGRYIVLRLGEREHVPMRIPERMAYELGIQNRLPEDSVPAEQVLGTLNGSLITSRRTKPD